MLQPSEEYLYLCMRLVCMRLENKKDSRTIFQDAFAMDFPLLW